MEKLKEVCTFFFFFQRQRFARDHHILRRSPGTSWILFPPRPKSAEPTVVLYKLHAVGPVELIMQLVHIHLHAVVLFNVCMYLQVCVCFEICAFLLCLSSKGFSPDNVMSGCVSSTNPGLDSNINSQSETPSSLCCVPSFHIQQH